MNGEKQLTKNTHLSSTSIVQLDGTLVHLPFIALFVPSKVKGTITEVSLELSRALSEGVHVQAPRSGILVLVGGLHHTPSGNQLSPEHAWEVVQGGETGRYLLGAREANSGIGDEVSDNGEHGDTAVLELDPTEAVEVLLVSVGDASEGIEEAEGGLGAEFLGEVGVDRGGHTCLLGGSEGSGGAGEGSEDGKLHHVCIRF